MGEIGRTKDDGWTAALAILERLRAAGFEALLAGGCVRDRLLGVVPKDYDVATNARPEEVLRLYPRARAVGAKFGVVLVRKNGQDVEVATFRKDGPYFDGRRPEHIEYGTAEEDARRRDFTINGLFFDPATDRVLDYVGGQEDLRAGIIRTIGSAAQRFSEDHLRMLRAARFAARLGFTIEPGTREQIRQLAPRLVAISPERIAMELSAILTAGTRVVGWRLLGETGLCGYLVPDWRPDEGEQARIAERLAALPAEEIAFPLALAALWADEGSAGAARYARALRCSNREERAVRWLLATREQVRHPDRLDLAALKRMRADRDWPLVPPFLRGVLRGEGADDAAQERMLARIAAIPKEKVAPPPLLSGHDMSALGVPPGRATGAAMEMMYTAQLNEEIGDRSQAEALVREWVRKQCQKESSE